MSSHIKIARMRTGLTQEQAAKKLGVHPTTLNKYESGARIPSGKVLKAMSTLYDQDVNVLLHNQSTGKEGKKMFESKFEEEQYFKEKYFGALEELNDVRKEMSALKDKLLLDQQSPTKKRMG